MQTWETEDEYEEENVFKEYLPYNKYLHPDRRKRATGPDGADKRSCTLFLQSDTMLWHRMTSTDDTGLGYVSFSAYTCVILSGNSF